MKRARVLHRGVSVSGVVRGELLTLEDGTSIPLSDANYLAPVVPRQIFAVHLTYRSRCEEYKMKALPAVPSYFMKPVSSVSHHRAPVARPPGCRFLNYEGEIAAVVGKTCSNVSVENALRHLKGYTIANDWGVHDFRHADRGAMVRVKGQDGFCPLGPFLVDVADLDPSDLWLRTCVNGKIVQEGNTNQDLLFPIAYQVADLSRLITLEDNDVILTGTPANSRPVEPGDVVTVEVSGVGRLENTVVELNRDLVPVGDTPRITDQTLHVALAIPEDEAALRAVDYQRR